MNKNVHYLQLINYCIYTTTHCNVRLFKFHIILRCGGGDGVGDNFCRTRLS